MEKNKIILIQVWLGKIPDYFWFHYETTKNKSNVDFLFITDQDITLDSENYKVIKITKEKIEELISDRLSSSITLKNNKKTCDLKASFGDLFYEYIGGYDYFGCYDIDTLFGDVHNKISGYLGEYDFISIGDKNFHNRLSGPFLLIKNTKELRELYKKGDFISCMSSSDVECYEEHVLNQIANKYYKVKIIDLINCEINNGGKNTYDVRWSGGKLDVNGEEKMIYHFYRKNHTIFQKVGNQIYGRYNKKFMDDFYWVFGFTKNYSETVKYLMDSINKYSNRKCVVYTINFDYEIPQKFITSNQFIFRRIDIPEGKKDHRGRDENIISSKPKLMLDVLDFLPNKKIIFIDSDVSFTVSADDINQYFSKLTNYPLINSHTHDKIYLSGLVEGEQWTSTIDIIANKVGVEVCVYPRRKTNIMLFDENSRWFFQEQIELYETYKDSEPGIFAFHDEDSANLILSKYKLFDCLHLCDIEECDDIDMGKFLDTNHPFHMTGLSPLLKLPKHQNDVVFFHGLKDVSRFQSIEKIYGNTVLDCEELLVTYSNNTIFFEKNSFLTSKKIDENVDFIISDLDGSIIEKLENQELMNYWVFYISNVFLPKKSYIIEIVKTHSKTKIYNNLLEI